MSFIQAWCTLKRDWLITKSMIILPKRKGKRPKPKCLSLSPVIKRSKNRLMCCMICTKCYWSNANSAMRWNLKPKRLISSLMKQAKSAPLCRGRVVNRISSSKRWCYLPIPARLNFRSSMNCRFCIAIMIPQRQKKPLASVTLWSILVCHFLKKTRHRQIISVSLKRHASALMRLVSIACYCAPCSKPTMHRPISDTLGLRMRHTATLPHQFAVTPTWCYTVPSKPKWLAKKRRCQIGH